MTKLFVGLAIVLAGVGAASPAFAGEKLIVGKSDTDCPGATYLTISAAVSAAPPGSEIEICPALYDEQVVVSKPLWLHGRRTDNIARVLVQPSNFALYSKLGFEAVIAVVDTAGVTIDHLALDASKNTFASCSPGLAAVHFRNASGRLAENAISGAQLATPTGCAKGLPFGNGFGVQVDSDAPGPYSVVVEDNSIHDYTANGVLIEDTGVTATVQHNGISGVGPSSGVFQFGIFVANGAVGHIFGNVITEGNCGAIAISDCIGLRSEGVTLRAVGNDTIVDGNIINKAQSGIFINGGSHLRVTNNIIGNIDAMSGMDIQGSASSFLTHSLIANNTIFHVGPIDANASNDEEGCGITEYSGTGVSDNTITNNTVNDAYCAVAAVSADLVEDVHARNTLYNTLNADQYPNMFPPAVEP
jgi:hypothetical protein